MIFEVISGLWYAWNVAVIRLHRLFIGLLLVAVVAAIVTTSLPHILRGALLSPDSIALNLRIRANTDGDPGLSVREIRRALVSIIRSVIMGNPDGDVDGDGVVNKADITNAVRGFRSLMLTACNNGTVDTGEQCDDGNTVNGDGCSAQCRTEAPAPLCPDVSQCSTEQCMRDMLGTRFMYGINIAWFRGHYGWDMGKSPHFARLNPWYNSMSGGIVNADRVSQSLNDIRSIGYQVVRLRLSEARGEGLVVDSGGIVTGLEPTFINNLDDLLLRSSGAHIKLYLVIASRWDHINRIYGGETSTVYIPSPLINPTQQTAYINNIVRPLARRYRGNAKIFAFDIFNEIESEVRTDLYPDPAQRATQAQAKAFIKASADAIHDEDPARLVSAGSGWTKPWDQVRNGWYNNLGLDFFYLDTGSLVPNVSYLNVDKPVFVGEYAQHLDNMGDTFNVKNAARQQSNDAYQESNVLDLMTNIVEKGYAGATFTNYFPENTNHNDYFIMPNGQPRPVVNDVRNFINDHTATCSP